MVSTRTSQFREIYILYIYPIYPNILHNFLCQGNAAAVALDCGLLTLSKETYDHSYNFSHDSSMDKRDAVKVLRQYFL